MSQGHRPDRVGEELRMELSELLAREVHDPGIGFLTLTHVQVTPDLQHARVFYTTLGQGPARRETERALERAAPFLRRQIGRRLRLRRVPELHFIFDEGVEAEDRVERLLREIHDQQAQQEGGSETGQQGPGTGSPPDDGDD